MKLSFLLMDSQKQNAHAYRAWRWSWAVGLGLTLCGNVGQSQEPTPANPFLLQVPAPESEDPADTDAPAIAAESDPESAPPPAQVLPARAAKYSDQIVKLRRLKEGLIDAPGTAERIDLQIEALTQLIQHEASDRLEIALGQSDAAKRDQQLKDLVSSRLYAGTPAAEEAGDLLQKRNVDGKLYPDETAAQAAQEKLDAQDALDRAKAEQKATAELEKLSDPDISDELRRALERLANERFAGIRRLVPAQQVCRLQEFIRDFPGTRAAAVAQQLITLRKQESERVGQERLRRALRAPLVYDQRWRRLKELVRDLPQTSAALEAESLLNQHATTLPTTTISNQWSDTIRLSVGKLYDGETVHQLFPGESIEVTLMFPASLRVSINEDVQPMRIVPGSTIGLQPKPTATNSGYSPQRW